MEQGLLQYILQQTGAVGLAGLSIVFLNKAQEESIRRADGYSKNLEALNERLFSILGDTIRTVAGLQSDIASVREELRELRRSLGGSYGRGD